MPDIVYALTNLAMPGLVKIGRTTMNAPEVRMTQLYTTGVPLPFECAVAIELEEQDAGRLEKALHVAFDPNRVNPKREFFAIDVEQVEAILRAFPGKDVTPGINEKSESELEPVEREATKRARARRPNLNFQEMGIPDGSTLTCVRTGMEITVAGPKTVSYKGEEMSITRATKIELDLEDGVVPAMHWCFEGRKLREIYNETHSDQA